MLKIKQKNVRREERGKGEREEEGESYEAKKEVRDVRGEERGRGEREEEGEEEVRECKSGGEGKGRGPRLLPSGVTLTLKSSPRVCVSPSP